jgi:hypothetical protein
MKPFSFSSFDIRATDDTEIDRSLLAGRIVYTIICLLGLIIVSEYFN